jgi:tetratricopeptide (TPR) repeat protein
MDGSGLLVLGKLDFDQGRYKEALAIYDRAKAVLLQHKEGSEYGVLLSDMAIGHQCLHQWNEAVACHKEAAEHHRNVHGTNHPEYAGVLENLAVLFDELKQYRRPSRDMRRHSLSVRGCMLTKTSALLLLLSVLLLPANM